MQTNLDCHPTQKKHTGCTGILRTEQCQKQEHILDPRAKEAWRDSDLKSTKQTEQSGGEPPKVKKQLNLRPPSNMEHNRLTVCVSSRQTVVAFFFFKDKPRTEKCYGSRKANTNLANKTETSHFIFLLLSQNEKNNVFLEPAQSKKQPNVNIMKHNKTFNNESVDKSQPKQLLSYY